MMSSFSRYFRAELHAEGHMGALHLVVHGLAHVVEQAGPLGGLATSAPSSAAMQAGDVG